MATTDQLLTKLGKLKVDRATGDPAPHKPLLLLVILELAEQESLATPVLALTPELAFRFFTYWSVVAHRRRQRPDVRLPFHHLQSDGFWSALGEDGKPSADRRLTRFAGFTTEFFGFLREPLWRDKARRLLIAKYFRPDERIALYSLTGLPIPSEDEIACDASIGIAEGARAVGREARFRLSIVAAYNYTCALTGYRLTTITAGSIVDAAHIHQFANSRNNHPRNGLALCKNAHWQFDNGLWTLSDDYKVIVAVGRFTEENPDQKGLLAYHGIPIRIPSDPRYCPDPIHIAWHRKHKFQGL